MAGNNLPSSILDQIREIKRQLAEIRKNKGLSSSAFRGEFQVLHASLGHWLLKVGLGAQNKYFLSIRRDDGTVAIEIGTTAGGDQFWAGWDRAQNIVLSDDATAGQGLARPWLAPPVVPVLSTAIPTTNSASYISLQSTGQVIKQQPYVELEVLVLSTGGGIGNVRFTCNGSPIGTVIPVTSGLFAWQTIQTEALPGNYNDRVRLELQAQRTNGAGAVGGVFRCSMRQTP